MAKSMDLFRWPELSTAICSFILPSHEQFTSIFCGHSPQASAFFLLVDLLDAFCPVMVWSLTSRNWSAARPVLLGSVRMPKGRTRNGTKSDKENFHRWFRRCFFVVDF